MKLTIEAEGKEPVVIEGGIALAIVSTKKADGIIDCDGAFYCGSYLDLTRSYLALGTLIHNELINSVPDERKQMVLKAVPMEEREKGK